LTDRDVQPFNYTRVFYSVHIAVIINEAREGKALTHPFLQELKQTTEPGNLIVNTH
jgi:hypothetical protein